jgi:hypothetical protein
MQTRESTKNEVKPVVQMQLGNYGSVIMKRSEENQALHWWVKMMEF